MNRDGSDKKQVTKEEFRLLNQRELESRDGRLCLWPRNILPPQRSLGTREIGCYHVFRRPAGCSWSKKATGKHQKEPRADPTRHDGKSVYYTRNINPRAALHLCPGQQQLTCSTIEKYDMETGEVTTAVSGLGWSCAPIPRPMARRIASSPRDDNPNSI